MPEQEGTPPEVPEEFAEAYLAAYRAALEAQSVPVPEPAQPRTRRHAGGPPASWRPRRRVDEQAEDPEPPAAAPPPPDPAEEPAPAPVRDQITWDELPERTRPIQVGTHRVPDDERDPTAYERFRDSGWLVPVLLLVLGLLLVIGAYVLGRAFATHVATHSSNSGQSAVVLGQGASPKQPQPTTQQRPVAGAWTGAIIQVQGIKATADCASPPSVDAGGQKVTYGAQNLVDGAADTTGAATARPSASGSLSTSAAPSRWPRSA